MQIGNRLLNRLCCVIFLYAAIDFSASLKISICQIIILLLIRLSELKIGEYDETKKKTATKKTVKRGKK